MAPEVRTSVEQAVEDLEALREALGVERWVLFGYSYGGADGTLRVEGERDLSKFTRQD